MPLAAARATISGARAVLPATRVVRLGGSAGDGEACMIHPQGASVTGERS